MNRESQVIVDPGAYLNIINTKKAVFKGAPDSYNVKSRVYYDPSVTTDTDDLNVKSSILNFVADGLKFDEQVVKSKASYALPYNKKYLDEIFQNKNVISDDYKIEIGKYKKRNEQTIKLIQKMKEDNEKRLALVDEIKPEKRSQVKFKPISFFVETKKISISDGNLKSDDSKKLSESILTKSTDNFDLIENVFLTEIEHKETPINQYTESKISLEDNLKSIDKYDWDEYLIDSLSEHTARWIVYKKVTNPKQKQKLLNLIESKYGRYTRNPDEIELVEDSLSEFEKQKIKEEKDRLKAEKMLKENPSQTSIDLEKSNDRNEEKIPLYRLPHGLKQIELEKTKRPDPNYNTTAKNLDIEPSRVLSPKNYVKRMEDKNVTEKSLMKIEDSYTNEMLAGNDKQIFTKDKEKIYLENGKTFTKSYQTVYPEEFTVWLNGAELETKVNEEKNKKPTKGLKKWKKYPELIDNYKMNKPVELNDNTNFWHLLPSVTPDTELRKILKSNFTVAKILDEWRHRWETNNKWTLAEVEQLINDMKSDQANIRFQAVVICSRAIERMQLLIDKLGNL
ncbi:unnamed protein product [Brachionus calyciflorus]|uniref:Uncharacterized protein n=1 Tax=Brachionus calyciflorus TaxID=104777 RepID=A0A814D4I8_9BILA|nr:unnamed protein product [Brachionus calyciflorus]